MSTTDSNSNSWFGYHGTSFNAACHILTSAFRPSVGDSEWLGHGVYFFIEGLNDPFEKAAAWAKQRAHRKGRQLYSDYAVLEAKIETSNHLDLDVHEDQVLFEAIREKCRLKMIEDDCQSDKSYENDCYLANFAMDNLGLDAMVRKEAILTESWQVRTRYPNCRIMCLRDPVKCIQSNRIARKGSV